MSAQEGCFDEKGPDIGIHHPPPSIIINELREPLVSLRVVKVLFILQSGRSSPAKHGDAYFSAVYGFIKDPIATPGLYDIQVP